VTGLPDGARFELAPGYDICRLIVGGWQLSAGHKPDAVEVDETLEGLVAMADMGLDTFDCADIYTGVEELYGRSLRRLGVETLDLIQLYWWDFRRGDWLRAVRALGDLRREGKIRQVGATNFTAGDVALMESAGVHVVSDQVQYSALDRRPEGSGLAAACSRFGMHLLCYGALAGGFLTATWHGAPDPGHGRLANRSLVKYRLIIDEFGGWEAYQALLSTLSAVGEEHGVDAAAVALRFVLDRPGVAAAIVGFSSAVRMRDNLRALSLRLSDDDHARIHAHSDRAPGPRGDIFGLERDREGPHGRIMRYDLNAEGR
jgi:aryl-alcohol dehydrogenase-like predicted oxidoreductase